MTASVSWLPPSVRNIPADHPRPAGPHRGSERADARQIRGVLDLPDQPDLGEGVGRRKCQALQLPSPGSLTRPSLSNRERAMRAHAAFMCSPRERRKGICGSRWWALRRRVGCFVAGKRSETF